jgi:hypothetical protein
MLRTNDGASQVHKDELENKNQNQEPVLNKTSISNQMHVKVTIPILYREVQLCNLNRVMYGNLLIENGKYIKLEPS